MNKYLLEIGTEELPYKFIPPAIEQLKKSFADFLADNKIEFSSIEAYATPRRLAVIINNLSEQQPDEEKIVKGPIKNVAYDENGSLTKAGLGFGSKCGVNEKDLFLKDNYLHAKVFSKGKLTKELLKDNVASIILKLQGPHFMRWGENDQKFSRPIRWIVSIFNNDELPIQIVDVKSSRFSRGHRFSKNANLEINNADEYIDKLKESSVIINQDERKALIIELAKKEADKLGAIVSYDDDLSDEVTYLCEYPLPVVCDFDEKYLNIPEKVTVTVMAQHQRYFALYKNDKLLNKFITVTNYLGDDFSNIKAGNERVISARLEDAIFFFNEDTKKSFENYVENLKGITFQKGMGSVYDKTQRIIELSKIIGNRLNADLSSVERTAFLCKADLTTNLVFEFTELQGFVGADYAKISGENEKVVQGIEEHYFPLNADSELAQSKEGQVVGIADKLDTICAVFTGGKIPTGSSDPLGVRRAALGIIKTIINKKLDLNLPELIEHSLDLLPQKSDISDKIEEFFIQRLIIFLSDNYRKDILEACSTNKNPLSDLCDFVQRIQLVSSLINKTEFQSVLESSNRISKILGANLVENIKINTNILMFHAERDLYNSINSIDDSSYQKLIESLILINPPVKKFFEDVLVMDPNEDFKRNRLAMLTFLKKKYELIANFSALQI